MPRLYYAVIYRCDDCPHGIKIEAGMKCDMTGRLLQRSPVGYLIPEFCELRYVDRTTKIRITDTIEIEEEV